MRTTKDDGQEHDSLTLETQACLLGDLRKSLDGVKPHLEAAETSMNRTHRQEQFHKACIWHSRASGVIASIRTIEDALRPNNRRTMKTLESIARDYLLRLNTLAPTVPDQDPGVRTLYLVQELEP